MDRYYVTTPIYYASGTPFIGNAYTTVLADALARFARLEGKDTYFLTGTDEHGTKIVQSAAAAGVEPGQWVDDISAKFRDLWPTLNVECSDFIRTTEERHKKVVQTILQRVYDAGDIYLSEKEGLYCVGCELFYDEEDLADGKCPTHGTPAERVKEPNYYFRMSRYYDWWTEYLAEKPDTIRPERYRNEVLNMLKKPTDLSISRPKSRLKWGIELPFDRNHVAYVWFDALINYVSALGWPDDERFKRYWPVAQHIIGKDILRPHGLYWPIMLKAAGIDMYQHLNVHGFWQGSDGRKMSKSLGNSIDPAEMRDIYGADAVRYALLREMPFGVDANIGDSIIAERMNTDLANDLGNLVSRTLRLVFTSFEGKVPQPGTSTAEDDALRGRWRGALPEVTAAWHDLRVSQAIEAVMECIRATNRYFDANKPWELAKNRDSERLGTVLYSALESLRVASVLFWPVMPERMETLRRELGTTTPRDLEEAKGWGVLPVGQALVEGDALFPRVDVKAAKARERAKFEAAPAAQKPGSEEPGGEADIVTIEEFRRVRLKVGTILSAEPIPKATELLKLTVDLGEGKPRQLVAGIAEHYAPERLAGRQIVLVANLEPATVRGIRSEGMLLAAESASGLSLLTPDGEVPPGAEVC